MAQQQRNEVSGLHYEISVSSQLNRDLWKIIDGKLYLNCSREAFEKWSRDIPGHIKKADAIWKEKFGGK